MWWSISVKLHKKEIRTKSTNLIFLSDNTWVKVLSYILALQASAIMGPLCLVMKYKPKQTQQTIKQWVSDLICPRWRHPSLPEDGSPCSWEKDPPGYLWKAAQPDGPKLTGGGEEEEEEAEAAGRQPWRRNRRRERKDRKKISSNKSHK